MDAIDSYVFYEMLTEEQRDPRLGELPGVLLKQSPPQVGDEVLIGSDRPWRVHAVESYGIATLAWIVRADLPTPDRSEWITEIRAEFHEKGGLSIVLTPNGSVLQWGGTEPDDPIGHRIGERINKYEPTGAPYLVAGLQSQPMIATPSSYVIEQTESFKPTQDSSYTEIHFCWCQEAELVAA